MVLVESGQIQDGELDPKNLNLQSHRLSFQRAGRGLPVAQFKLPPTPSPNKLPHTSQCTYLTVNCGRVGSFPVEQYNCWTPYVNALSQTFEVNGYSRAFCSLFVNHWKHFFTITGTKPKAASVSCTPSLSRIQSSGL